MKTQLLIVSLGLLASLAPAVHGKIERVVEKTFAVAPGGSLHVATYSGSIRVEVSAESVVKITAKEKIRADSESEADELLKNLHLVLEEKDNEVSATAALEKSSSGFHWGNQPVQVDFVITVPTRFAAELKTSGGDIIVGDLDGKLRARTSGGNVRLGKISGEIDAATSGGNVELAEGKAGTKLSTSGGNIAVEHVAGPTVASTSGGNIKVSRVEATLSAKTSGGDVTATFIGGLRGDCGLSTSGGRIKAYVDPTAGFQLDAATSGGSVKAEGLTITIEKGGTGKSHLTGAVSGGGPVLKLRSSGGDVVIVRH